MLYVHTYNLQGTPIHSSIGTYSELGCSTLTDDARRTLIRRNLGIETIQLGGPDVMWNGHCAGAFEWGPLLGMWVISTFPTPPKMSELDVTRILDKVYEMKATIKTEIN